MLIEMVFLNIFWLNAFPHRLGVSQTLSPRALITGLGVNYKKKPGTLFLDISKAVSGTPHHSERIARPTTAAPWRRDLMVMGRQSGVQVTAKVPLYASSQSAILVTVSCVWIS